jgi:hypothetical protein
MLSLTASLRASIPLFLDFAPLPYATHMEYVEQFGTGFKLPLYNVLNHLIILVNNWPKSNLERQAPSHRRIL